MPCPNSRCETSGLARVQEEATRVARRGRLYAGPADDAPVRPLASSATRGLGQFPFCVDRRSGDLRSRRDQAGMFCATPVTGPEPGPQHGRGMERDGRRISPHLGAEGCAT